VLDLSIIIPFKDKSDMTIACVNSLFTHGEAVQEIILVSNNSSSQELAKVAEAVRPRTNVTLLEYNKPFNFQAINNWAVRKSQGRVVMLLNNDIELVENSQGLLEAMYKEALKPETGAVGCVLLYEDNKTIQHAGVYLVAGGTADHLYIQQSYKKVMKKIASDPIAPDITKNMTVSAVTAAAVMIEREKFEQVKGLNEDFIICGGDVDLCLRLEAAGHKSVLLGASNGYMIHKESKSRSMLAVPYVDFLESYKSYIKHFDMQKGDPHVGVKELKHAQ